MKINRILSTAGVDQSNSMRLRSYCNLMQGQLIDKWLFADDFVESHVCIVADDYLPNLNRDYINKSQIIVVCNKAKNDDLNHKYQVTYPLTAENIKIVLNKISTEIEFKPLNLKSKKSKKSIGRFKSAFLKIRKNLFGKQGLALVELKRKRKEEFIKRLTNKANINMQAPYKVVLLGSPGSGKTTAIESASKGNALNSDVAATDSVAHDKIKTTVGIDYATINLPAHSDGKERKLSLYGTPGQIKFNFIWDMVGKNADAFIILLDLSRPEPLSYLKFYKKFLKTEIGNVSQVYCALTHSEKYKGDLTSYMDCIESEFPNLKGVYDIDARKHNNIMIALNDIYSQIKHEKQHPLNKTTSKLSFVK